jgi:hypothetical protein
MADPAVVHRRLAMMLDDQKRISEECSNENPAIAAAAYEKLVPATVFAFGLKPFDPTPPGSGCGEDAVITVWNDYQAWLAEKKNTGVTGPPS